MRRLMVFNQVSLDGYFVDAGGDMSWAHRRDAEWDAFTNENASGGGVLLFGRRTYDLMSSFWPSPEARRTAPFLAERMNEHPKIVFSRTLDKATWANTKLIKGDLAEEVRKLKQETGPDMVLMGSGTIVSQLTEAGLIDEYQLVLNPIILGGGRTLFDGLKQKVELTLKKSRPFSNGNVVLWYEPKRG